MIRYLVRRHSLLLNTIPDLRKMDKDDIGRLGENIAARYLYAHGARSSTATTVRPWGERSTSSCGMAGFSPSWR